MRGGCKVNPSHTGQCMKGEHEHDCLALQFTRYFFFVKSAYKVYREDTGRKCAIGGGPSSA
jgi:hypothetical protein